jgi:hypothetical protein
MAKVDPELCETCLFYDSSPANYRDRGLCRRYPPFIRDKDKTGVMERQSIVLKTDWCGEYSRDPRLT